MKKKKRKSVSDCVDFKKAEAISTMAHIMRSFVVLKQMSCHTCGGVYRHCRRSYTSRNILQLYERGIWADRFPDKNQNVLIQELCKAPQTVYSGFDPTADSLHVGNLLVIMALLHCQRAGHNVIAVVGGATAQVGDPSGRSNERPLLSIEEIHSNSTKISENLKRIFKNHKELVWERGNDDPLPSLRIVNNADWYNKLNVVDFLRDFGRNLRLVAMLSRKSVRSRLDSEEGMSFTEFTYQALQAYDWLYLYDNYQCTLQIGGADQMGNIVSGYELISKTRDKQVTGLTIPLITTEAGNKFGKSAGNAVWLDRSKTSPFDLYQFFLRSKDTEVEKYLNLLTFYPVKDIEKIMESHRQKPELRNAQKKLADKVTLLVHGQSGLDSARRTTDALYGGKTEALAEMTAAELQDLFKSAASASLLLHPGTSILKMAMDAKCFRNESDARQIITAGGFYINMCRVNNPDLVIIPGAHILPNGITLVRVGKRNYYLVKWLK